jgi:predicted Holliday junction resolvase-like endonuclease
MKMATEKIIIQIGNETEELKGADKQAFIADQETRQAKALLLETEYKAKQKAREDAIKKLAEVAGLTEEEINAIL